MAKFQIGDLCVTQYTTAGVLNNGLVVEVLDVSTRKSESEPTYLIRRIDGQPIPATLAVITRAPCYFGALVAWTEQYKLRRANQDDVLAFLKQATTSREPVETGARA